MIQGRVLASSSGPSVTRLELTIHMADDEANALVSTLMSGRADSPILGGSRLRWSCRGLNPHTIALVVSLCLKQVVHCSINVVLATSWVLIHTFLIICEHSEQSK